MDENINTSDVLERIFEASTLESAIFRRQQMLERLEYALSVADSALNDDERNMYICAKAQTELAIDHLQAALAKNERWSWVPTPTAQR